VALNAEPLGGARDMAFFGDRENVSEVTQLHCHTLKV
jgi:hypothetical protein